MRKISKILVLCIGVTALIGCSSNTESSLTLEEGQVAVYYVDSEALGLAQEAYAPLQEDTSSLVEELYQQLIQQPKEFAKQSAIPQDVSLLDTVVDGSQLTMNFGESYYSMDSVDEVLCRAAIVRTMLQIDGIDTVEFTVANQPLIDKSGHTVGVMTSDTFVDINGSEDDSYQQAELNLYFSNTAGNGLVLVKREVLYHSNISMERLVVEQLLKGISKEENTGAAKDTLPTNATLLNLYTKDGVCYVNFDENFLNQSTGISEEVVIYSLVDSLTELPGITKVQISVNGISNRMYKDKINLNTMFERDTSYMEETE